MRLLRIAANQLAMSHDDLLVASVHTLMLTPGLTMPGLSHVLSSCHLRNEIACANFSPLIVRPKWKGWKPAGRAVNTVLSVVLASQMLAILALAASPELHHLVHSDSDRADHHCLVTLFAKGQISGPELLPVVAVVAIFLVCAVWLPDAKPRLAFEYRFAPSRAPPRS